MSEAEIIVTVIKLRSLADEIKDKGVAIHDMSLVDVATRILHVASAMLNYIDLEEENAEGGAA